VSFSVSDPPACSAVSLRAALRIVGLALSLCAIVISTGTAVARAAPAPPAPLLWTVPGPVDGAPLETISCPSLTLCVAGDHDGYVLWSTDPADTPAAWHGAEIPDANEIVGISCPTVSFCAAIDAKGDVITSEDPTGGAGAWTLVPVDTSPVEGESDSSGPILDRGISCPTAGLCVAVDAAGNALVSSDPAGGAGAWSIVHIDGDRTRGCDGSGLACQAALEAISCPSVTLCVAGDFSGNILWSFAPTSASGPWPGTPTDGAAISSIYGVSCPTSGFCASVDGIAGRIITFDPGDPAAQRIDRLGGQLDGVWCSSASLCLVSEQTAGGLSQLLGSTDPGAARPTWGAGGPGGATGAACPSPALCLAVDGEGNVSAGVTIGAVRLLLEKDLLSPGTLPSIASLARSGRLAYTLTSPIASSTTLTWTVPRSARKVGELEHGFAGPGGAQALLLLTPFGRSLLRDATGPVPLTVTATFGAGSGSYSLSLPLRLLHPLPHRRPVRHPRRPRRRPPRRR
jgi:hypothetical protein